MLDGEEGDDSTDGSSSSPPTNKEKLEFVNRIAEIFGIDLRV